MATTNIDENERLNGQGTDDETPQAAGATAETETPETVTTETPAETPEPAPAAGTDDDGAAGGEAGGTGAGAGYDVPMPEKSTKYSDLAEENKTPLHDEKELEKARKRDRREKRLANAGQIMDTLARVFNYVATTQGAPSARWAARDWNIDENKYYDKLANENKEARKDYFNNKIAGDKADNDAYQMALNAWGLGKENARKDEAQNWERELHPEKVKAAQLANAGAELDNTTKKIINENLPEKQKLEKELLKSQAAVNNANAAKTRAEAVNAVNEAGSKVVGYLPMIEKDDKGNWIAKKDTNGNVMYQTFTNTNALNTRAQAIAQLVGINNHEYSTSTTVKSDDTDSTSTTVKEYAIGDKELVGSINAWAEKGDEYKQQHQGGQTGDSEAARMSNK